MVEEEIIKKKRAISAAALLSAVLSLLSGLGCSTSYRAATAVHRLNATSAPSIANRVDHMNSCASTRLVVRLSKLVAWLLLNPPTSRPLDLPSFCYTLASDLHIPRKVTAGHTAWRAVWAERTK